MAVTVIESQIIINVQSDVASRSQTKRNRSDIWTPELRVNLTVTKYLLSRRGARQDSYLLLKELRQGELRGGNVSLIVLSWPPGHTNTHGGHNSLFSDHPDILALRLGVGATSLIAPPSIEIVIRPGWEERGVREILPVLGYQLLDKNMCRLWDPASSSKTLQVRQEWLSMLDWLYFDT